MTDEQTIRIETKLAHQEQTIAELDAALISQQSHLMTLERQMSELLSKVQELADAAPAENSKFEVPPHY